jgi:hypothetical protein
MFIYSPTAERTPAPVPVPAPIAHAPANGRPPTAARHKPVPTLSPAARRLVDAVKSIDGPATKAKILAAGVTRAEYSEALSEAYRARALRRAPGADVAHVAG